MGQGAPSAYAPRELFPHDPRLDHWEYTLSETMPDRADALALLESWV